MLNNFEQYLNNYNYGKDGSVKDAVMYSIVDGGKRIRPHLLLALLKDYGVDASLGHSAALAIEMIHSYSLIHDDLPAMDDDDFRRSKLSTHKQFGEDIAILAGDALLTEAFAVISNDKMLSNDVKVKLLSNLAQYAGINGMIYGQQLDLEGEGKPLTLENIEQINHYKTANLITFSVVAAALIAQHEEHLDDLKIFASKLGLAFQIQDDIFDVTKTYEQLGKKPSDVDNDKSTYVKLLGLEQCEIEVEQLFKHCYEIINALDLTSQTLYNLVSEIQARNK